MADAKVALVVGAGDATGGAIARRFARGGYTACVTRRSADKLAALVTQIEGSGGKARAFGSDARNEDAVIDLVTRIEAEVGPIEVAVFNIGANVRFPIREMTSRVYFKVWEMACFAGFLMGREVAKVMVPRRQGTIIFTGATASVRGGAGFAAFAGAKHGLRALAQSMARELGPEGIHVAHSIIDGPSTPSSYVPTSPSATPSRKSRASSIPKRSQKPIGRYMCSRRRPGRMSSTCGPGSRSGDVAPSNNAR